MRVGITGHQRLPDQAMWQWVVDRIDDYLAAAAGELTGLTSLAIGADQLFAERVITRGGRLYVIVPHEDYESTFKTRRDRARYESLLLSASTIEVLEGPQSREDAYLRAGHRIADLADAVLAVWNGRPAAGKGGTADMVQYALDRGVPVIHINPLTAQVHSHRGSQAAP